MQQFGWVFCFCSQRLLLRKNEFNHTHAHSFVTLRFGFVCLFVFCLIFVWFWIAKAPTKTVVRRVLLTRWCDGVPITGFSSGILRKFVFHSRFVAIDWQSAFKVAVLFPWTCTDRATVGQKRVVMHMKSRLGWAWPRQTASPRAAQCHKKKPCLFVSEIKPPTVARRKQRATPPMHVQVQQTFVPTFAAATLLRRPLVPLLTSLSLASLFVRDMFRFLSFSILEISFLSWYGSKSRDDDRPAQRYAIWRALAAWFTRLFAAILGCTTFVVRLFIQVTHARRFISSRSTVVVQQPQQQVLINDKVFFSEKKKTRVVLDYILIWFFLEKYIVQPMMVVCFFVCLFF